MVLGAQDAKMEILAYAVGIIRMGPRGCRLGKHFWHGLDRDVLIEDLNRRYDNNEA